MDTDMALGNSSGLVVTMALGGNTGYSDGHDLGGSVALGHQHGSRLWPRPQASSWSLVVKGTMDINTDPSWVFIVVVLFLRFFFFVCIII